MCSWGAPHKGGKFYKGVPSDTPWNKDLLWRKHVAKETTQMKINLNELPDFKKDRKRVPRMKMGITGTLIPDTTPRHANSSMNAADQYESLSEYSARSRGKSSASSSSTSSMSSYTTCSSTTSSVRMARLQKSIDDKTLMIEQQARSEIQVLRAAMEAETKRRERAEKRLDMICAKIGIEGEI